MLRTTQTGLARRSLVICAGVAALAVTIADLTVGGTSATLAQTAPPPENAENAVFYYQNIDADEDLEKFQGAYAVVTAGQGDEAGEIEAATTIKTTGAKALRYVNFYWYPKGRLYQGINIGKHMNWTFCGKDGRKLVGRKVPRVNRKDEKWFFLDANERAARKAIVEYLEKIKDYGYNGVFFDRGASSFLGSNDGGKYISWKKSTCTNNKVAKRKRTFSDVFASLLRVAHQKVFTEPDDMVLVNFGKAPYTKPQIRPNPRDKDCRQRDWRRCSSLGDVWEWVDQVIDEAPSHQATKFFKRDLKENRTSERHFRDGPGPGRGDVLAEVKVAVSDDAAFKKQAYYQWAQARLFRLNLFVNTGDDECPGADEGVACWRYGTRPDLTKVSLGRPVDPDPTKMGCDSGSKIKCLWIRRYARGMVVVNVSPTNAKDLTKSLGLEDGDKQRMVRDVYDGNALVEIGCIDKIEDRNIPAKSGRVFVYDTPDLCPL